MKLGNDSNDGTTWTICMSKKCIKCIISNLVPRAILKFFRLTLIAKRCAGGEVVLSPQKFPTFLEFSNISRTNA